MALPACGLMVRPGKIKTRARMIELHIAPTDYIMARLAIILRVVFFFDVTLVNVLMAIGTAYPNPPEIPSFVLFVAYETGCGHMCPFQPEPALFIMSL